ncbi:hypothetical protein BC833DRAFT_237010 [Globomyces pollinis-pini]|nr:hypothetical protein BC833DRAFT_237010 [Globomyces pollinis-pini]
MSTVLLFIAYLASHFAAPVGLSLTSPETVVAGGFVKVSWTNANTANTDDWICFTKGDNPSSSSYLPDSWQYTYGSIDKLNQHPLASGSVSVKAPGTPGTYKLFYCENNGYTCKASVTVTVTIPKYTCRPKGETASSIKHVITIISENHSFDSYFGKYCRAPVGSRPTCTTGRDCCEMGTPMLNGLNPVVLNDQTNGFDPCHSYDCMLCQINDGKMDKYLSNGGCPGSDNRNYAMADGSTGSAGKYWKWASEYAMSDRFFQSAPGK